MRLLIDKLKLMLLLEKRRDNIDHKTEGVDTTLTGVLYILSLLCSDFHDFLGVNHLIFETIAWITGIVITVLGIVKIVRSSRNKYSHNTLYSEIENLDEVTHRFSLAAIKDTFNEHPNRFLVYYDNAWDCWFFFSFPTSDRQNEESIMQRISSKLKIDRPDITLAYISQRLQPKFSKKDNKQKLYLHDLYYAEIKKYPEELKEDDFEIDGVKYRWMTLEEMDNDKNIHETNDDVISFIREKIG